MLITNIDIRKSINVLFVKKSYHAEMTSIAKKSAFTHPVGHFILRICEKLTLYMSNYTFYPKMNKKLLAHIDFVLYFEIRGSKFVIFIPL